MRDVVEITSYDNVSRVSFDFSSLKEIELLEGSKEMQTASKIKLATDEFVVIVEYPAKFIHVPGKES